MIVSYRGLVPQELSGKLCAPNFLILRVWEASRKVPPQSFHPSSSDASCPGVALEETPGDLWVVGSAGGYGSQSLHKAGTTFLEDLRESIYLEEPLVATYPVSLELGWREVRGRPCPHLGPSCCLSSHPEAKGWPWASGSLPWALEW